jgi:beta-glucosidase-like glycosyl hydrolase
MVTGDTNIHMPSRRFTPEEINNLGSIFNVFNRNTLIKIQDEHLKHNKIPLLFMADVEWGHFVFVPTALGQSATFDTELIEQISKEAAEQASMMAQNPFDSQYPPMPSDEAPF